MNYKSQKTDRHGIFTYTPLIYSTYLGKHEKSLLLYYANHYNWKSGEASYHSEERICNAIPMSPRSYVSARTNLKNLGWIYIWKEYNPGRENLVIRVKPMLGRDDPELLAKKGGRPPLALEKHQKLVNDFKAKHPELSKHPKVQKLAFPVQNQSLRVQKILQTDQKALTNYESLRLSIKKLNEI